MSSFDGIRSSCNALVRVSRHPELGSTLILSFSAAVYAVLALEWIQTILLTVDAFESFVYNYGNPAALTSTKRPGWYSLTVLCGLVSVPVQWYFSWRIYRLFKTIWLCSIICFVRRI